MIFIAEPKCELEGLWDLENFIKDNESSLENEQGYQLERIYNSLNCSIEDVRKVLKQIKELDNIEDVREYVEDLLDDELFSINDLD